MQEKYIKQDFWIRGKLIVVEDVPTGVCPPCGEKVVKANVGRWITKLLENTERIAKAPRISFHTIKFDVEETIVTYPSLLQGRKGSTVFTIRICLKQISVYNTLVRNSVEVKEYCDIQNLFCI